MRVRNRVPAVMLAFITACGGGTDEAGTSAIEPITTTSGVASAPTSRPIAAVTSAVDGTTLAPETSAVSGSTSPPSSTTTLAPSTAPAAATTTTITAGPTTSTPATTAPPAPRTTQPSPHPTTGLWSPEPGAPWQWQLTEPVDRSVDVPVYDIDLFENAKAVIDALHGAGHKVICYLDTGAWESYRPDAGEFPEDVIGNSTGWEGERWLDVRQIDVIGPIIGRRMDLAVAKGCDAIEPDQNNGWENDPGFPITRADSIAWNIWVAEAAHSRGLSVGLKNSITETAELEPYFDWALNEECFQYNECDLLQPFLDAGKAVLQVEYALDTAEFCPQAKALGFSSMRKRLLLDAWREPC